MTSTIHESFIFSLTLPNDNSIYSAFSGTDSKIQSKYGLFPCKI
jgi:hypothetical protein